MKKVILGIGLGIGAVLVTGLGVMRAEEKMANKIIDKIVNDRMKSESIIDKYKKEYNVESVNDLPKEAKRQCDLEISQAVAVNKYGREMEEYIKGLR